MASTGATTYTRGEWAIAVCNAIQAGSGASGAGPVDFVVGWTVAEFSATEAQTAFYNCLNCENGADIAGWKPKSVSSNGIVAFPSFANGVAATAHRLTANPAYAAIVEGIKNNSLNPRELSSDSAVQRALGVWVNGPNGGPVSQGYINNIIAGSGANNDVLPGIAGDSTITNQDSLGQNLGGSFNNSGPSFSATQVIKVLGGALMILAGIALFIKSLGAGAIAKVVGK